MFSMVDVVSFLPPQRLVGLEDGTGRLTVFVWAAS